MALRRISDWVLGKMPAREGLSSIEQSAQGGDGVPSLERSKRPGYGTWGCDLEMAFAVLG